MGQAQQLDHIWMPSISVIGMQHCGGLCFNPILQCSQFPLGLVCVSCISASLLGLMRLLIAVIYMAPKQSRSMCNCPCMEHKLNYKMNHMSK